MDSKKITKKEGKKQFIQVMEHVRKNLDTCSSFECNLEIDVETGKETVELRMLIQHQPLPKIFSLGGKNEN